MDTTLRMMLNAIHVPRVEATYGVSLHVVKSLPVTEGLRLVAEAGFTQVELPCSDTPLGRWWHAPKRMKRLLDSHGLRARTVHAPQSGWNLDLPLHRERMRSIEAAWSVFQPAAEVGAEIVVVHPNEATGHVFLPVMHDINFARSVDSIGRLADRSAKLGMKMAVENMPTLGIPRPGCCVTDILDMVSGLGLHVGVCVDAGHVNANGDDAAEEARYAGERVFCVHIQDNDGRGEDQHLVPGDGTTRWTRFINALDLFAPRAVRTLEVPRRHDTPRETLDALAAVKHEWTHRRNRRLPALAPVN